MASKNAPSKEALTFLREVLATNKIDLQQEISICLSDIPRDKMSKAKNGKIYVDIIVGIRKEPDQWGRDLKVYCKPTAQDKEKQLPKNYVGGGRMTTFVVQSGEAVSDDDLNGILPTTENNEETPFPY